jgi:hypothetical protein
MATTYSREYNQPMRSRLDPFSNRQRNALTTYQQRPAKPSSLPSPHERSVVQAVSKLVGSDITDAILSTADGSDFKSIDDYTLYEVMKVVIDGPTDRPQMTCWSSCLR